LSDTTDISYKEIVRRLDVLINVLLETGGKDGNPVSMVTRIKILHQAGMRPIEVAKILGKKMTYVNKELSRLRKEGTN
jgi:hypothetical protein